jgi:TonB family protein
MNLRACIAALSAAALTNWAATSAGQAASDAGAAVTAAAGKTVTPPRLTRFADAVYPEAERAIGTGSVAVLLEISIGVDGKVVDVTVAQSAGAAFDDAAVAAARQFEFEPAQVDGIAVPVRIQYRYDMAPPTPAAAPPPATAEFVGVVRNRKSGQPLPQVTVELDGVTTTTDALGRFQFADVAPGTHSIMLSGQGFAPTGTEETLVAGQRYDATYEVEPQADEFAGAQQVDLEVVIVDVPVQRSIASTSVSAEQGSRVAGTGGDVIKVVENLPGVARSSVGSSALVVWGSGAGDTRVYVDDVHIPMLYHEGGFRSVIHSDLVQRVELEPGGYGAAHGRGLGGLVTVGLKPLEDDRYHGSIAGDAIDAAASVRGPIGHDVHFAAAVRRSHLDWVLARATSKDVGEIVPIPRYWDGQLRAAWTPREGEKLELGGLLSSDHISRSVVEADPSDTKRDSKDTGFQRVYLRYERHLQDGGTVIATPFFGLNHSRVASAFGAIPAALDSDAKVYGLRTAWSGHPAELIELGAGIDAEVMTTTLRRSGAVTSPPREGDIHVFGQAPSDQINADDWTTTVAGIAPFVQGDVSLAGGSVHLVPGMRVEPSLVRSSRRTPAQADLPALGTERQDTHLEPRFAARWALTDSIGVRGAVGLYHQPPLAEDLSAVFGNPTLGPARAMQYLGGANVRFSQAISLEVTGFFSQQNDLVTRSPLPTPVQAQALIEDGRGRAYGGQVLLRHELTGRFFGWLSYSLVRSQRTDGGSKTYRLFDFDQTHVLTALGSYDLGAGFEVGVRFRYSTGYPRTPVLQAVYDSRTDSFQPLFGVHNGLRIPAFYELDARVSKRFSFGGDANLELYLDVQNMTDHRNPEEIVYNFDYSKKSYITGLPVLPVLGGKLSW